MWTNSRRIAVVMLVSVAIGQLSWARVPVRTRRAGRTRDNNNHPTALELLDKSLGLGRGTQPYIITFEILSDSLKIRDGGRGPRQVYKLKRDCEMRSDGIRKYERIRYFKRKNSQWDQSMDSTLMYDGKSFFRSKDDSHEVCVVDDGTHDTWGWHPLVGYFHEEDGPLDSFLRRCRRISVRPGLERVGNSLCYVIDAENAGRKYTIWIDPEHSYNIAKADIFKGEGAMLRGGRLDKGERIYDHLEILRFEKFKDVWVPAEARLEWGFFFKGAPGLYRETQNIRCTKVILNPDHEALRSFYPDEIPSGAEIKGISFSSDIPDQEDFVNYVFRWQPGAKLVVNRQGRLVSNNPNKNVLPIVKLLTGFEDLVEDYAVELDPLETPFKTEGKMILQCFWDVNQEQSQQVLLALTDRQESLTEKGVSVITLEASGAQADKVLSWALKNKLAFPVGAFHACYKKFSSKRDDLDDREKKTVLASLVTDLRMAWRIEKLPWLILTDREHVVAAEGFAPEELDEKIKDAEEAEAVTNKIARLASKAEENPSGQLKGELRARE